MRILVLLATLAVALAVLPTASASPGSGALTFDGVPSLTGLLTAHGSGEFRLGGAEATLSAQGEDVQVRRVFYERSYVQGPTGGSVEVDVQEPTEEEWQRASGTIEVAPDSRFLALVSTQTGGTIDVPEVTVDANRMAWLDAPRHVASLHGSATDDSKDYTYQADGPRLHVSAVPSATARGAFAFFVSDATITFTGPDGKETWVADEYRVDDGPGRYREGSAWFLITIGDGTIAGVSSALDVWLHEPVLELAGTIEGDAATGALRVDGTRYSLDGRAVRVAGTLELKGAPAGKIVEEADQNDIELGRTTTAGRYTGSSVAVAGDVTRLDVAGQGVALSPAQGGAIAAAVGVAAVAAGAAILLSPGLKWSLLGGLVPLYAKTQRDRILDNVSRDRIFQAIRANPGLNLSRIHRLAELGWGVTVYHLKMLEKAGLVFSENGARDRCFFENVPENRKRAKAVAALANKDSLQRVAKAVAEEPHLSQSDVVATTGMSQRAVSYSLKRLVREGLVDAQRDGVYVRYDPHPELVTALAVVSDEELQDPAHVAASGPVSTQVVA